MSNLLAETYLLNYNHKSIQLLIEQRDWNNLDTYQKIENIYNFVKDEIKFGYNTSDYIKASEVLEDGYGQCNTKSILFMALLRATGIECMIHGFTIDKELQKGAITGIWYKLAPQEIIHSWVEIFYENQWLNIEGFILDDSYLCSLQSVFNAEEKPFEGYGVATDNFKNPQVNWCGKSTYIQKEGIHSDYGIFEHPDEFFGKYIQKLNPFKKFLFVHLTRHVMNRTVNKIRNQ
jgi:hypothetical protein